VYVVIVIQLCVRSCSNYGSGVDCSSVGGDICHSSDVGPSGDGGGIGRSCDGSDVGGSSDGEDIGRRSGGSDVGRSSDDSGVCDVNVGGDDNVCSGCCVDPSCAGAGDRSCSCGCYWIGRRGSRTSSSATVVQLWS
jgi:hypothetical protein